MEKFFVKVKGGTPEERSSVKETFKEYSAKEKVDVDLVDIEMENGDMTVRIETPCGEVELTKEDILRGDKVIDAACGTVRCKRESDVVAAVGSEPEKKEEKHDDLSGDEGEGKS